MGRARDVQAARSGFYRVFVTGFSVDGSRADEQCGASVRRKEIGHRRGEPRPPVGADVPSSGFPHARLQVRYSFVCLFVCWFFSPNNERRRSSTLNLIIFSFLYQVPHLPFALFRSKRDDGHLWT